MSELNGSQQSVRPKVRANIRYETRIQYEPLDKKSITFVDQQNVKRSLPLISKEFNVKINCVTYYEPSIGILPTLTKTDFYDWLRNCKRFDNLLNILLNLPHFRFWSVLVYNEEVRGSLKSYLRNARRPYNLQSLLRNGEVIHNLSQLHRKCFDVYSRILLWRESEKNFLTESFHSQLILGDILNMEQLNRLVQLFAYGSNSEVLKHLLRPIIGKNFQHFHSNLQSYIGRVYHQYLGSCIENFHSNRDLFVELDSLINSVNDIFFSLNKLFTIEPKLASILRADNLAEQLIIFYAKYIPFVEAKFEQMNSKLSTKMNFGLIKPRLNLTRASVLLIFHHYLVATVHEIITCDSSSDRFVIFDSLINALNVVTIEKQFCYDYFSRFDFEDEFVVLKNCTKLNEQLSLVDTLEYYSVTVKSSAREHHQQSQKIVDKSFNLQYRPKVEPVAENPIVEPKISSEVESKIQTIQEMFPDYGDGFILLCLEHYEFNNEKVVDAMLECNLPPELSSLDTKLKQLDLLQTRMAIRKQKATISEEMKTDPKQEMQVEQIYIGKKDKSEAVKKEDIKERTLQLSEKIHEEEVKKLEDVELLIERGKLTKEDLKTNIEYIGFDLYDDEFDDTYENEDTFDLSHEPEEESEEEKPELPKESNQQQQQQPVNKTQPKQFGKFAKFSNRSKQKQQFRRNFDRKQSAFGFSNRNPQNPEPGSKPEQRQQKQRPPPKSNRNRK